MSFFANITPFIIHPGDEGDIPGNTIEAVEHAATQWHALSSGVQGAIEADFRQLRDGTIIVCRYPHVEVDGKCYEWHEVDGEQIAKANAAQFLPPEKQDGRFFKIPTLQEFCAAVRTAKFKLIAEIKVDESASLGQK
ncbi:MAG TPA: hypothetical protein DIS76_07090, partial [Rhodospirillaceae bacterium]|nr:hypothetical protein [Rhodospirillaceae bacterium]